MTTEMECPGYDAALLGDDESASKAVTQIRERLFGRALAIVDRRLNKAGFGQESAEDSSSKVIAELFPSLFCTAKLRELAGKYQAEQGRSWDNYVLQQVHWGAQDAIKRLRREAIAAPKIAEVELPPAAPPATIATGLPCKVAAKVDQLPQGQRAVWTLRCAPTFDPRNSDRDVMADFSQRTRDAIDAELFRLVGEVWDRELDREQSLDLSLKLAKLRHAIERREHHRSTLLGLGVPARELHAIERAVEREHWTAEQARTAWKNVVRSGLEDDSRRDLLFEQFSLAAQQVRKRTAVVRASHEQLRSGAPALVVDHANIATTLQVTTGNSQKLFSRANLALGLRRSADE